MRGLTKPTATSMNIDAFDKNRRNFKYLGIQDFPPVNDGFELDIENEDQPDTPKAEPKQLDADF